MHFVSEYKKECNCRWIPQCLVLMRKKKKIVEFEKLGNASGLKMYNKHTVRQVLFFLLLLLFLYYNITC